MVNNNSSSFLSSLCSCPRQGVGYSLRWMLVSSILFQSFFSLLVLFTLVWTSLEGLLCKCFTHLVMSSIGVVCWLSSLISVELLYTAVFVHGRGLKKSRIARRLLLLIIFCVCNTDLYELFFYRSFFLINSDGRAQRSISLVDNYFIFYFFSILSTLTICLVVINKKLHTSKNTHSSQSSCLYSIEMKTNLPSL